jgi:hypothetical protein
MKNGKMIKSNKREKKKEIQPFSIQLERVNVFQSYPYFVTELRKCDEKLFSLSKKG